LRFLALAILFSTTIFAISINESLLKIHATLVPKISLMDYDFKTKVIDNKIVIVLYYEKSEYKSAIYLKNKIKTKYANGINGYAIKCKLVKYTDAKVIKANIIYLFPSKKENILKVTNFAKEVKALTFAYLEDYLIDDIMISVKIGSRVKPIINLSSIKRNQICLRPILVKISEIYTSNSDKK